MFGSRCRSFSSLYHHPAGQRRRACSLNRAAVGSPDAAPAFSRCHPCCRTGPACSHFLTPLSLDALICVLSWLPPALRPAAAAAHRPRPLAYLSFPRFNPRTVLCRCTLLLPLPCCNSAQHAWPQFRKRLPGSSSCTANRVVCGCYSLFGTGRNEISARARMRSEGRCCGCTLVGWGAGAELCAAREERQA